MSGPDIRETLEGLPEDARNEIIRYLEQQRGLVNNRVVKVTNLNTCIDVPKYDSKKMTSDTYLKKCKNYFIAQGYEPEVFHTLVPMILKGKQIDPLESDEENLKRIRDALHRDIGALIGDLQPWSIDNLIERVSNVHSLLNRQSRLKSGKAANIPPFKSNPENKQGNNRGNNYSSNFNNRGISNRGRGNYQNSYGNRNFENRNFNSYGYNQNQNNNRGDRNGSDFRFRGQIRGNFNSRGDYQQRGSNNNPRGNFQQNYNQNREARGNYSNDRGQFRDVTQVKCRSLTFEEHLVHIRLVFERLREARLSINLEKSHFAKRELSFLGHLITQSGLVRQPEKVRAIVDFPEPRTVKQLLRFHGMAVWYSSFINNFSSIAAPLYRLLRKKVRFVWGPEQVDAFNRIKKSMTSNVMLHGLDYNLPIYVRTDSSDIGLGAVLVQYFNGKERPIYFASKSLSDCDKKLPGSADKECLAIVWAINKFKDFLWGAKFTVLTDNQALTKLRSMHNKSRNLTKWSQEIEEWGCEIVYCPGKENVVADCLSRAPVDPLPNETDHLNGSRDVYMPIFGLTYFPNLLHKIELAQLDDIEVQAIRKVLDSKASAPLSVSKDTNSFPYSIHNNIVYRSIVPFENNSLLRNNNRTNPPWPGVENYKGDRGPSMSDVAVSPEFNKGDRGPSRNYVAVSPEFNISGSTPVLNNKGDRGPSSSDVAVSPKFGSTPVLNYKGDRGPSRSDVAVSPEFSNGDRGPSRSDVAVSPKFNIFGSTPILKNKGDRGPSNNDVAVSPYFSNFQWATPVSIYNSNSDRGPSSDVAVSLNSNSNNLGSVLPRRNILVPYLPISMRNDILNYFHDAPESGHMGVKKTKEAIKQRFYWNNMNTDIHNYVKSCKICQEYKVERQKPKGLMGDVPQATSIFETLFIDFIGPLPMYSNVKFPPPPVVDSNDDQSDVAALSLLPVLSSEFKQYRKHLNEMKFFTAMHPKYEQVNCWSIPPSSKSSNVVPDNPTIYIDTEDKFHQFSNMLDNLLVKEIAIDLEFDSNHLFHDCTALMQMSSINFNILRGHLVRSEFLEEIVVVIQKFLSREIAQILQIPIEKDESKSVKISQSCQGVIDINECWEVTEPAGPSESEIESLCSRVAVLGSLENNPEIGRATDESSLVVDKMEIEQIHDESSSLNVNSQSIDRPMTKKYKNFLSRTLKKQNFKRKNEERVKAGLPIMIKSRNAGLAHRKRTEARKLLKLPTGPLLPPGSYFRRGRVSGHGPL
ncbi:Retrovirus-related Pol polyprotein from transposon opus [Folsomia candida]|uniref:RNA-directed DNA polymerase n=1 Tax=Folsomia candida TaxID=158441 RepID=A0A226DQ58_FOLCA|nr:Retrovirus-related Pol polyprotein from transposon opus [Folsomia candida]